MVILKYIGYTRFTDKITHMPINKQANAKLKSEMSMPYHRVIQKNISDRTTRHVF